MWPGESCKPHCGLSCDLRSHVSLTVDCCHVTRSHVSLTVDCHVTCGVTQTSLWTVMWPAESCQPNCGLSCYLSHVSLTVDCHVTCLVIWAHPHFGQSCDHMWSHVTPSSLWNVMGHVVMWPVFTVGSHVTCEVMWPVFTVGSHVTCGVMWPVFHFGQSCDLWGHMSHHCGLSNDLWGHVNHHCGQSVPHLHYEQWSFPWSHVSQQMFWAVMWPVMWPVSPATDYPACISAM